MAAAGRFRGGLERSRGRRQRGRFLSWPEGRKTSAARTVWAEGCQCSGPDAKITRDVAFSFPKCLKLRAVSPLAFVFPSFSFCMRSRDEASKPEIDLPMSPFLPSGGFHLFFPYAGLQMVFDSAEMFIMFIHWCHTPIS